MSKEIKFTVVSPEMLHENEAESESEQFAPTGEAISGPQPDPEADASSKSPQATSAHTSANANALTQDGVSPAPKPRSLAQQEASRRNGTKSKGAISLDGKAASSKNAITHGLSSKEVVLHTESRQDYENLLASYMLRFQPADQVEHDLVEEMAAAQWRIRRARRLETAYFDMEMARHAEDLEIAFNKADADIRTIWVLQQLAHDSTLTQIQRHETRLARQYSRALKMLESLRSSKSFQPSVAGEEPAMDSLNPPHLVTDLVPGGEKPSENIQNDPGEAIENARRPSRSPAPSPATKPLRNDSDRQLFPDPPTVSEPNFHGDSHRSGGN